MNTKLLLVFGLLILTFQTGNSQNKIGGMTAMGGADGFGVIFTMETDGSNYQVVHHFDSVGGKWPESKLVKAPNGKFYGTTLAGGIHNDGTLFEIDPSNGNFSKKIDFHDPTIGSRLQGNLTLAPNGKLYGAAMSGGANWSGTIFEYDTENETLTKIFDFDDQGLSTGAGPFGTLVLAPNGKFYGTCYGGGANTLGTIFEFDPTTGIVSKKVDLSADLGGRIAFSLTLATNGKLYCTPGSGGLYGGGTIVEFDPADGSCVKLHDFDYLNTGGVPIVQLTLAYNGKLYGTASWGGKYNDGTLFELDYYDKTITKRFDFEGVSTGKAPRSGLLQSSNGKLYGTTEQGGAEEGGVIFEFDPNDGSFVKKLDFSLPNGAGAQSCEMTLLGSQDRVVQVINFDSIPTLNIEEPLVNLPATASSGLTLVYFSSDPATASVSGNVLTINKTGSVTITARQGGNANYLPAFDVSQLLTIDSLQDQPEEDSVDDPEIITGVHSETKRSFNILVNENPFKGSLRFQVSSAYQTSASVVLYSMKGQRIHESQEQTNTPIELQMNFTPGIYLIQVQTREGQKVLKVMNRE